MPEYFTVTLRSGEMGQMGCIALNSYDEFYFHNYTPFDRADAYGKSLVIEATEAKVAELNTLRKIIKRLTS